MLLAGPVMITTIALAAAFAHWALAVPVGVAIVIAAALAPTDPVLAADVTVRHAADSDRLRLALTGEAGLNDGAAFPFVVLGIEVMREGGVGAWLGEWAVHRLLWAIPAGLVIGLAIGFVVGRLAIVVRTRAGNARGVDALLALATAGLAYAAAEGLEAWAFLAAFGAGLGFRRAEMIVTRDERPPPTAKGEPAPEGPAEHAIERDVDEDAARHPTIAAGGVLRDAASTCETLERGAEIVAVVAIGALLWSVFDVRGLALAAFVLVVARPVGVLAFARGDARGGPRYRALLGWLGVRGVGSLYYAAWAFENGVGEGDARTVASLVVTVVAASIVLHGVTTTPLVRAYERRLGTAERRS